MYPAPLVFGQHKSLIGIWLKSKSEYFSAQDLLQQGAVQSHTDSLPRGCFASFVDGEVFFRSGSSTAPKTCL